MRSFEALGSKDQWWCRFRLRRVHFFLRKKDTEPKKTSPYDSRKIPPPLSKLVAAQIGRPWPNFALRDLLSLRFTNLVNFSGGNPREVAAPLMCMGVGAISQWLV